MEFAIASLLVVLAVFLWRVNGRDQYHLLSILQSVLALVVFYWIGQDLDTENGYTLTGLLAGFLVLHFIISRFWKSKAAYWPPIFVLISSSLFFLFQTEVFDYDGFKVNLTQLPVILLPVLGASVEMIADVKEKFLGDFFKIDFKNRRGISRSVYVFLLGFLIFLGHFTASYVGVGLVVLGFSSSLLYQKKSGALWNMLLGVIAIASIGHFASIGEIDSSSLLQGRVLEGLLFGGFISLFINTILRARKKKLLAEILSWFLMVLIPTGLILIGGQFISLGGVDAFIGLVVGFAIAAFFGINTRKNSSVLAIYFALGIVLIPLILNKEAEVMTTITLNSEQTSNTGKNNKKQVDIFESAGKEIDAEGVFSIVGDDSQLTFELGQPGGRTKGAFKIFSGTFTLSQGSKSIQVTLPVDQLTTFNKYRDESLMDEGYFNQAKYPEMKFIADNLEFSGDSYLAKGKFTMLGVTKDKDVELKYLGKTGKNGAPVFIGRAQIDRTQFGMKSDPREGDIVDFTFKVELK